MTRFVFYNKKYYFLMIFDETKVLVLFSLDRLFLATKRSKKLVLKKR